MAKFANAVGDLGLVPFAVRRLSRPFVAMTGPEFAEVGDESVVEAYGWMIPSESDQDDAFVGHESRIVLGERYGGRGIGGHGGGVRCGLCGDLQIKDIGANPLAAPGAPLDYNHGGMSLFECIQEALWGEIFTIALPCSAVRIHAVIGTNTQCWWVKRRWGAEALKERYGPDALLPRGPVVRDAALRPAHFLRALVFNITAVGNLVQ